MQDKPSYAPPDHSSWHFSSLCLSLFGQLLTKSHRYMMIIDYWLLSVHYYYYRILDCVYRYFAFCQSPFKRIWWIGLWIWIWIISIWWKTHLMSYCLTSTSMFIFPNCVEVEAHLSCMRKLGSSCDIFCSVQSLYSRHYYVTVEVFKVLYILHRNLCIMRTGYLCLLPINIVT